MGFIMTKEFIESHKSVIDSLKKKALINSITYEDDGIGFDECQMPY